MEIKTEAKATAEQVAEWLGVSKLRVEELAAAGRLPAPAVDGWELAAIVGPMCSLLRAGRAMVPKEVERVRRLAAQRKLLEIQIAQRRGELVEAADVLRSFEQSHATVRAALMTAPERFGLPREPFEKILAELAHDS